MAGLIPEDVINEVRERTDIVQVVSQHVQLKRAGANFKGLCPFHDEQTPSFNVNSNKQFYHCFGCGESGDAFRFLMKIEGRSFIEVVEDLALRASVELRREKVSPERARAAARQRSERQRGLDLNRQVADLYRRLLASDEGAACRSYLEERGVNAAMIEAFELGFAPRSGSAVVRLLEVERVPMELGEQLGLVARRARGPGHHDRFWNRLIFPVVGAAGEVLGFGGRMLGEGDGPKYINTPETVLYRKGMALFGLGPAAKPLRQKGHALVVEGNLDVVQLHQYGFDTAVAPMGTALTLPQVQLLRRFASKVIALFDGDEAGRAAALKSVPLLVEGHVEASIATLPLGQDPDSFLRAKGPEAMQRILDRALPAVEYLIVSLLHGMERTIPGRARVLERVAPIIAGIPSRAERDLYAGRLALELDVKPAVVQRAIQGKLPADAARFISGAGRAEQQRPASVPPAELNVLGVLVEHPHLFERAEAAGLAGLFTNEGLRGTYLAARSMQQGTGDVEPARLLEQAPEQVRPVVAKTIMSGEHRAYEDPTRALDDCLRALRHGRLHHELRELSTEMARATSEGDVEMERSLAARKVEVERRIHETR